MHIIEFCVYKNYLSLKLYYKCEIKFHLTQSNLIQLSFYLIYYIQSIILFQLLYINFNHNICILFILVNNSGIIDKNK